MKTSTLFPAHGPRSYRFIRRLFQRQIQHFERSLSRPKEAQENTLDEVLKGLRGTFLEEKYGLKNIHTLSEFRSAIPLQSYDDISPLIERIHSGEKRVLSREKVRNNFSLNSIAVVCICTLGYV